MQPFNLTKSTEFAEVIKLPIAGTKIVSENGVLADYQKGTLTLQNGQGATNQEASIVFPGYDSNQAGRLIYRHKTTAYDPLLGRGNHGALLIEAQAGNLYWESGLEIIAMQAGCVMFDQCADFHQWNRYPVINTTSTTGPAGGLKSSPDPCTNGQNCVEIINRGVNTSRAYAVLHREKLDTIVVGGTHISAQKYSTINNGTSGEIEYERVSRLGQMTWPRQSAFRGYLLANQNVTYTTSTAYDLISFTGEVYDINNEYASGIYTCTRDGKYLVNANIFIQDVSGLLTKLYLHVYKNGATKSIKSFNPDNWTSSWYNASISIIMNLNAAETCSVRLQTAASGNGNLNVMATELLSSLDIHKIS